MHCSAEHASASAARDPDLHTVLELASTEELQELSDILYGRSLLSPLVKSLAPGDGGAREEPALEESWGGHGPEDMAARDRVLRRLEARFLFLAADARATLRGERPTYRGVLLAVRERLKVACPSKLSTPDLESEIFLHLLQDAAPPGEGGKGAARPSQANGSDGFDARVALKFANEAASRAAKSGALGESLGTALRLGGAGLLSTLLKGTGAFTATGLHKMAVKKLTGKVLLEGARYQAAKSALLKGGAFVSATVERQFAFLAARQGLAGAAARYVGLRSLMNLLGPLMWGTLLADIAIQSLGTDYARVVRAIYAFAQIRLTRTYGWTSPRDSMG